MKEKGQRTKTIPAARSASGGGKKRQRAPLLGSLAYAKPLSKEEGRKMLNKAFQLVANLRPSVMKALTQADIASLIRKAGREDKARELCEEAMEVAKDNIIAPGYTGWKIKKRVDSAMGVTDEAKDEPRGPARIVLDAPQYLIPEITYRLANAGNFKGALIMAGYYRDSEELLPKIAQIMAKAGKFEDALALVSRINDISGFLIGDAKGKIASEMAKAGMFRQTVALSSQMIAPALRSKVQVIISSEMAKAGMFRKAREHTSQITELEYRTEAYANIATEMAKAGMGNESKAMFRKAWGILPKIKYGYPRRYAECAIALALTEAFLATQISQQDG